MKVQFFCPHWGSAHLPWNNFILNVRNSNYDGIEYGIGREASDALLDEAFNSAARHQLLMIAQHYDTYESDFNKHYDLYAAWLEKIGRYRPVKINSQTGKDFFSFDQNQSLIGLAAGFSARTGIEVCHESHRNKFAFAAHITGDYLKELPMLNLTLDISHWVCVAESYLEDQEEAVELAISRTHHLHARVGHPQGPQITDPRLPEWQTAVNVHLQWWDRVVRKRRDSGMDVFTVCPEFGPAPYMPALPFTLQPMGDQWDMNLYMMNLLRARWS